MIERPIEFHGMTMNDNTKADLSISPNYWIKVSVVDGIWGDELRVETHPIPCNIGERHGQVLRTGKQLTMTGVIFGQNLAKLREGQWKLMEAFWDCQPYKLYHYNLGFSSSARLYYTVYVNQPLNMADEIDNMTHWRQRWTVGLRADNPRTFKESDNTVYPTWQT